MTRVSTYGNYQSALLDLMSAQSRMADAQQKVNTKKNATDLVGFGRGSETVSALMTSQTRIQTFIDTNKTVTARLETQDLAMDRVADASTAARQAIADAIAAGRMDILMGTLNSLFMEAQDGLNMKHQGKYLFGGGVTDRAPVDLPDIPGQPGASMMAKLAALPDESAAFHNDQLKQSSWLDENVSMDTGFLADAMGSELFAIFRDIQLEHQTTPLDGKMTDAQKAFLTTQMGRFEAAAKGMVELQAANGGMQNRVDRLLESQEARKISIDTILSGKTDANMAEAVTELELAQISLQASAQVVSQLRQVSLLDYLR
ncbi:flagellin [Brevundimonas diminuta]|uniref:Flagellar hook-associated protein FlgL n=1 Tax=Brevundimonas diminuta TaxID=293 RepID=A0A2X1APS2_BREDI|nr:flagellin [Brevundimonas diminuta]SPU46708.1 flagellar hook-associated protein FlgL [Brevundimonas diminuta]